MPLDRVSERAKVQPAKQILSLPHQHRANREMNFVQQTCLRELPDRGHAAAYAHIASTGGRLRGLECRVNPARDEIERCPTLHLNRITRVVREDEGRHMVRGLITPPP